MAGDAERLRLIHNERVKLVAAMLDRASSIMLTLGVLGPIAQVMFVNFDKVVTEGVSRYTLVLVAIWYAAVLLLHYRARRKLEELR